MATFTIIVDGFPVECSSPEDAMRMIRAAKQGLKEGPPDAKRGPGRPPSGKSLAAQKKLHELKQTLAFLKKLTMTPKVGINANDVVEVLNLKGSRGVGGALVTIKRVLADSAIGKADVAEVFSMHDEQGKERRWKGGQMLDAAVGVVEEKIAEEEGAK